ncbi:hypothetical protein [Fulvivirga sp.]|uniref:hypothetical protein n=1 Tax=Fulvivirga sp. TaxID=1931237 RepID=UPI0032F0917E
MKKLIILIGICLFGILSANAQNDFYFDKWKAKGEIITKEVIFFMDSTNTENGREFNEKFGKMLSEKLQNMGIQSTSTFDFDTTDSNILIIKFDMVKPAYVKLNTFGSEIPLCNRFEINQVNKLPEKKNRQIRTTLAISVDKEENGMSHASNALANLIFESINK